MGRSIHIYAFPWAMGKTVENYWKDPFGMPEDEESGEYEAACGRVHDENQKYRVGYFGSSFVLACWFRNRQKPPSTDWSQDFRAEATQQDILDLIKDLGTVLGQRGLPAIHAKMDELFPVHTDTPAEKWTWFNHKTYGQEPRLDEKIRDLIRWLKPISEMEGFTFIYDE